MSRAPETVRELMTKDVVTIAPDDPVERAIEAMVDHDIGSVIVAEADRPVGIFTERDLTRRILQDCDLPSRRVGDVMSSPLVTVDPDMKVEEALERLNSEGIRRLVVTEGGRLAGIVTERDLIRWVAAVVEE